VHGLWIIFLQPPNANTLSNEPLILAFKRRLLLVMYVAFDDHEMAQRIFERIKDYIPQKVVVDENCNNLGLEYSKEQLIGTWTPYGLNHKWRVVCYLGTCACM